MRPVIKRIRKRKPGIPLHKAFIEAITSRGEDRMMRRRRSVGRRSTYTSGGTRNSLTTASLQNPVTDSTITSNQHPPESFRMTVYSAALQVQKEFMEEMKDECQEPSSSIRRQSLFDEMNVSTIEEQSIREDEDRKSSEFFSEADDIKQPSSETMAHQPLVLREETCEDMSDDDDSSLSDDSEVSHNSGKESNLSC